MSNNFRDMDGKNCHESAKQTFEISLLNDSCTENNVLIITLFSWHIKNNSLTFHITWLSCNNFLIFVKYNFRLKSVFNNLPPSLIYIIKNSTISYKCSIKNVFTNLETFKLFKNYYKHFSLCLHAAIKIKP